MSAVVASVAIGVAGLGVGISSSHEAAKAQEAATQASVNASEEQLAFQKQQYQDWEEVYGSIQDNLAEFYQNYDAEHITALGLQNIEREYNTSRDNLIKEMSQRGMDTSGLTAASLTQLAGAKASEKAATRSNAETQSIQAQQNFLGMGLGLESSLQQGVAGAYQNQSNLQMTSAASYGNQAAAAGQGIAGSLSSIGTALGTYQTQQAALPYDQQAGFIGPLRS